MKVFRQFLVQGLFYFFQGILACNPSICLRWKVTRQSFTLICEVTNIKFSVFIDDQKGNIAALCYPPYPSNACKSRLARGRIVQRNNKNEFMFSLNQTIDTHINGNWTCRHGIYRDIAFIEVTVLGNVLSNGKVNGLHVDNKTKMDDRTVGKPNNQSTPLDFIMYGMGGYGISFLFALIVKICCSRKFNYKNEKSKEIGGKSCKLANLLQAIVVTIPTFVLLLICLMSYYLRGEKNNESHVYMLIPGVVMGFAIGFTFKSIKSTSNEALARDANADIEMIDRESLDPRHQPLVPHANAAN